VIGIVAVHPILTSRSAGQLNREATPADALADAVQEP
jgi:hypothetical protein